MSFDPTKPVQTRDGREAGIYATDCGGNYPIHGFVVNGERRKITTWAENGSHLGSHPNLSDLVNVPDYPPLPDVKGGRLEYRGKGIKGLKPPFWVHRHDGWYSANPGRESVGTSNYHYAEFIPDAPTTVRGWIDTLPEGYRERAVLMIEDEDEPAGNLMRAVESLGSWKKSHEGPSFWSEVAVGNLPPIPSKPELVPYTVETFPMWAVWVRVRGSETRSAIREVCPNGITIHVSFFQEFLNLLAGYEIAGVTGEWHPAGQEVSK